MENASKALIIAGAILLSISIIGIGMAVFNMASSTINSANMSSQEIDTYNSEFIKYEGTQTGTTVKALCDTIRTHNLTNNDDESKQIVLNGMAGNQATATTTTSRATDCTTNNDDSQAGTSASTVSTVKGNINSGTRYSVSFGYSTTGLIKRINISTNTGS